MILHNFQRIYILVHIPVICVTVFLLCYAMNGVNQTLSAMRTKHLQDNLILSSKELNCNKIIMGDKEALSYARLYSLDKKHARIPVTEQYLLNLTKDCKNYRSKRKFVSFTLSKEEEMFPIAYSMVIHENIEMFERLLRSIYAPQNIYCVHVDEKSPQQFKEAVRAIVLCFDNVFVASKLESVVYASWSRVQADLNCMEDLLRSNIRWKYLINTCGTDLPLKTNAEIVNVLKLLNGKNNMESVKTSSYKRTRWLFHHEIGENVVGTSILKSLPPIDTPMFSGSAYFVVTKEFVKHIFEKEQVQAFFQWEKDTYSPDEHLWATLNRIPGVPGAVPHNETYDVSGLNSIARLVKWSFHEGDISKGALYPPCTGVHKRMVCIYGAGDLHWLLQKHHLFANKFDPNVDDIAIQCLEDYIRRKAIHGIEM